MELPTDPYHAIKTDMDQELQHLTTLQAKLFSGHAEVAEGLGSRLQAAAEQLQALESAVQSMVAEPSKFGLTAAAAFGRQVEVETLRYTLTDLQETFAAAETSSSGRATAAAAAAPRGAAVSAAAAAGGQSSIELPTLPPPGTNGNRSSSSHQHSKTNGHLHGAHGSSSNTARLPAGPPIRHSKLVQSRSSHGSSKPPAASKPQQQQPQQQPRVLGDAADDTRSWGDGGDVSYESIMQQQMQQQDQALDHISVQVDRIKHTGQLMHEELEEQAGLLGGLEEDTDTTQLRLRGLRKKVADVIRQSNKDRQLCVILVLTLVLVVLTVIAIA